MIRESEKGEGGRGEGEKGRRGEGEKGKEPYSHLLEHKPSLFYSHEPPSLMD